MGLFSNLFQKKSVPNPQSENPYCRDFLDLKAFMDRLLSSDAYIAKSDYRERLLKGRETIEYFGVLASSGMLKTFCRNNGMNFQSVGDGLQEYASFEEKADKHNDAYVQKAMEKEKPYLDHILQDVDPRICLDEDQRQVILTDEDYSLVIAGAGAGKTTTVAAKVKYLVEKKGIDPKQILVISFTNKAVGELRDKLNRDLNIPCPVATFHSTGNAILHKQTPERMNIVDATQLYYILLRYFKTSVLKNETMVNQLILFFGSYFNAPFEGEDLNTFFNQIAKANFSSLRSDLNDFQRDIIDSRTKKTVTIQSERMRSRQEVEIANFLYLNGIDYDYEPLYQYHILYARKPYTPDFCLRQGDKEVYLEHFGITEDGTHNRYSDDELEAYKKAIQDKIQLHKQHGTTLLYTFSSYRDGRPFLQHLQEQLEQHGFVLRPRSSKEVLEALISSEENKYISKLVNLVCRFISNFKTNGYTLEDFDRMYHATANVRTKLFLNICQDCYVEYSRYLKEHNAVDFEDMINESARILREVKEMKQKLDFKYIIVDEYQDISKQRFDLVSALSDVTDAKIVAVGDDWQSIYAFSGSDITLFTKFKEKMGYAKLLKIVRTYRNAQEVIDIAGNFIQKNTSQIGKALKSNKHIADPVIIYTYDGTWKRSNGDNHSGTNYAIAHAVETALEQIAVYNKAEHKPVDSSVLLLGRFGFDGDKLEKTGLFEYDPQSRLLRSQRFPQMNITFMTAHASKGLGYDNVIVVNGRNETYGFPSKIEDDPVLSFVIKGDRSIDYAEERRLFYVAMTRTKNRVFFIAPEQNPSEFLLEIKHDYKNVVLKGNWNEDAVQHQGMQKTCPICGYPLQYRYKSAYGLRLYICTNEPEVCGFMTNEYKAGKLSIMKCDECRDGYLIVKPGRDGSYFLGCTNYSKDGTGCGRNMSANYYYKMLGLTPEPAPAKVFPKGKDIAPKQTETSPVSAPSAKATSVGGIEQAEVRKPELSPVIFRGHNMAEVLQTILQCLSHISQRHYYGITVLVDVLRGAKSQKIQSAHLDQVPEYGQLRQFPREDLVAVVKWMIAKHYILQTRDSRYPVLHPTVDGIHYGKTLTTQDLKDLVAKLQAGTDHK